MNAAAGTPASAMPTSRWLITKIITAVVLSLLVVLGTVIGGHHEGEKSLSVAVAASTPSDADHSSPLVTASHSIAAEQFADGAVDAALLGSVGCLLGIFCCILLFVLRRWMLLRRSARCLGHAPRQAARVSSTGLALPSPLSLEQLSLSRT
ncbi:hypothetical protein [Microbacterium sp. 3J1]|uniref:hypothetical protein n=1 Tax=Microbacterium sp. 3J1 TaxID=861269 RepID=UPI0011470DDE|nr:hypothetical protein [Microbacterium sp. 3J1]